MTPPELRDRGGPRDDRRRKALRETRTILEDLARATTAEQITRVQRRARAWLTAHPIGGGSNPGGGE